MFDDSFQIYTLPNSYCMNMICYNLLTIQNPSMLLLSMLVDRWRIRYIVGWSFYCVTNKVYKKEVSMKFDSTIGTIKLFPNGVLWFKGFLLLG
jgi:hypothetical protein